MSLADSVAPRLRQRDRCNVSDSPGNPDLQTATQSQFLDYPSASHSSEPERSGFPFEISLQPDELLYTHKAIVTPQVRLQSPSIISMDVLDQPVSQGCTAIYPCFQDEPTLPFQVVLPGSHIVFDHYHMGASSTHTDFDNQSLLTGIGDWDSVRDNHDVNDGLYANFGPFLHPTPPPSAFDGSLFSLEQLDPAFGLLDSSPLSSADWFSWNAEWPSDQSFGDTLITSHAHFSPGLLKTAHDASLVAIPMEELQQPSALDKKILVKTHQDISFEFLDGHATPTASKSCANLGNEFHYSPEQPRSGSFLENWAYPDFRIHDEFREETDFILGTIPGLISRQESPQRPHAFLTPQPLRPFTSRPVLLQSKVGDPGLSLTYRSAPRPAKYGVELPKIRGGRHGPIGKDKASVIAKTRKDKRVCIRCKLNRVSCTGGVPCARCNLAGKVRVWDQPCLRAHFYEILRGGTCNFISMRSINHLSLDGSKRITALLPESFDIQKVITLLKDRETRFQIRARQLLEPVYTLDLKQSRLFLSRIAAKHSRSGSHDLREFIDETLLDCQGWQRCVKDWDPTENIFNVMLKINTMPSRATFEMVSLIDGSITPMDIENREHDVELYIAALLSKIVCRALELHSFRILQKMLNEQASSRSPERTQNFVQELGKILLTLRWRTPRDPNLANSSAAGDVLKQRYVYRVEELTKTLYFYFCINKRKLPSFTNPAGLDKTEVPYEAGKMEELPHADDAVGFEEWMKKAHVDWSRRIKVLKHGFRTLSLD